MQNIIECLKELFLIDLTSLMVIFFTGVILLTILSLIILLFMFPGVFILNIALEDFSKFKKNCCIGVFAISIVFFVFFIYCHKHWFNKFRLHNNLVYDHCVELFFLDIIIPLVDSKLDYLSIFVISLSKYSVSFILLFSIIYPVIFLLMGYDCNYINYRFYLFMLLVFILSYIIILTDNILLLYFSYEAILVSTFYIMYNSSNSRGGIEGSLFFISWAIFGSTLVGFSFIYLATFGEVALFSQLDLTKFTHSEIYCIYMLFFFGFGSKLSIWPLWYWLPKAHVEVSTSTSIYLSCVLIKLSFYCLIKVKYLLLSTISLNICIMACLVCILDITVRLIILKDLKAIVAYSSVLHTNFLILLIHLDSFQVLNNTIMYVWGHSLATACMFLVINLIESKFGTRSILQISGLFNSDPLLGAMTLWSLIALLGLPLNLFFWGEVWLWNLVINKVVITGTQVLIFATCLFLSIFFKIWWNVLNGTPTKLIAYNDTQYKNIQYLVFILLFIQYLLGCLPSMLIFGISDGFFG